MKKLTLLFAGLSLFVATGCTSSNDDVMEAPLVGVWQPLKEVVTTVETGGEPVSDRISDTEGQKQSRWRSNADASGKKSEVEEGTVAGQCNPLPDKNFTYIYDKGGKSVQMKYQGIVEPVNAKVITLDATTLNLAVREETQDPTVFKTRTYTFKRIPQ